MILIYEVGVSNLNKLSLITSKCHNYISLHVDCRGGVSKVRLNGLNTVFILANISFLVFSSGDFFSSL